MRKTALHDAARTSELGARRLFTCQCRMTAPRDLPPDPGLRPVFLGGRRGNNPAQRSPPTRLARTFVGTAQTLFAHAALFLGPSLAPPRRSPDGATGRSGGRARAWGRYLWCWPAPVFLGKRTFALLLAARRSSFAFTAPRANKRKFIRLGQTQK